MRCGREEGGRNVDQLGTCPAFPDHGKNCANVVGTFCDLVQALRAKVYSSCAECPFFNSIHFDGVAKSEHLGKGV